MRLKGDGNFVVSSQLDWRSSARCDSDTCVEIAIWENRAYLRNSRDTGRYLVFDAEEWRSFLAGAQDHEFDIG